MNDTEPTTYERSTVSYETARRLLEAAVGAAREAGMPATIVVGDVVGEPVAIARTDGAGLLSMTVAAAKAWTAANAGASTEQVHSFIASDPAALACMPTVPRFSSVAGGLPITTGGGRVIGAIGVSGGTSAQDVAVARAALDGLGEL
ncbi:heme-binding protein [Nocardia vinacea]|uniref:Heme-binding protein n=1 Tax=Nocardia vinacea TaxID=96468 RepID=A0ABZ1YLJ0_9NOCA|nr:heme-binding protein [Nocardia vinacea]